MEVPHCRAKVKVRVRTGGENRTAPAMAQRQRMTVRAGGSPFDSGEGIVQRHSPLAKKDRNEKNNVRGACRDSQCGVGPWSNHRLQRNPHHHSHQKRAVRLSNRQCVFPDRRRANQPLATGRLAGCAQHHTGHSGYRSRRAGRFWRGHDPWQRAFSVSDSR